MSTTNVYSMVGEYIITVLDGVYKLAKIIDFRSLNKTNQACYLIFVSNIEIPNDKLKLAYELGSLTLPEYMEMLKQELDNILTTLESPKDWDGDTFLKVEGYTYIPVSFLSSRKAPFVVPHELYGIPMLRI